MPASNVLDRRSDTTENSAALLRHIRAIEVSAGSKRQFELTIELLADPNDHDSDSTTLVIHRNAGDIERLQETIRSACCQQNALQTECPQCGPLVTATCASGRIFRSVAMVHTITQARLASLVDRAVGSDSNKQLDCEGFTRAQVVLALFFLRDMSERSLETLVELGIRV